eukprot:TRINITY_DN8829_c0_g1_i1.p1 TRINITY_DN8829_c0_g1~~TRINITY_DN8829_c0_g1_i1.p1  ORF type:complete len:954 (-),score=234.48 TRINITY_DN8829_c0_g1_i1:64-2751(-)
MAVTYARDIGNIPAEDLSDVLVATIAKQLPKLSAQRVSFFITAFAKQKIQDRRFWRAAATAVLESEEVVQPQVLVSFLDAFRKSGLRSERLFRSLTHRLYGVLADLPAAFIPPIVATLCRVPLQLEERERALRALLGRWLSMLRSEREQPTGAITVQQILSLTVSIGLSPEEINTAVFARDVAAYVGDRFELLGLEDLVVFLWGMLRLVPAGTLTAFFVTGLQHVTRSWRELQMAGELSLQRLTQLSEVVVETRRRAEAAEARKLNELQELVLVDLVDAVQHCQPETLAELLEIWSGNELFWRRYRDFTEAVTKRTEELLLESADLNALLPLFEAIKAVPGLADSLPGQARRALAAAARSRGEHDVDRLRALLAGTSWEEVICGGDGHAAATASAADAAAAPAEADGDGTGVEALRATGKPEQQQQLQKQQQQQRGPTLDELLASWGQPQSDLELADFLTEARPRARGAGDALRVLQAVGPFAQRLAASSSSDVLRLLEEFGNDIAADIHSLESTEVVAALRTCAISGLPHAPLVIAATACLDMPTAGARPLVEALEACAALRISIPELKPWFSQLLDEGVSRRLPADGLSRLLAAAARLGLVDAECADALLQRLVLVASPVRPLSIDTLAALCQGLYLAKWRPDGHQLFHVAHWLKQMEAAPRTPPQAVALRNFALSAAACDEGRDAGVCLGPELQRALALAAYDPTSWRAQASDTLLKFRHEVSEELRRAGRPYDLDLRLGPSLVADLALLGAAGDRARRSKNRSTSGRRALWLLDGPEAYHRPFVAASKDASRVSPDSLQLVPAELRRAELLSVLSSRSQTAKLEEALRSWAGDSAETAHESPDLGLRSMPGEEPVLARLSWLEWSNMPSSQRLAALSNPAGRTAITTHDST